MINTLNNNTYRQNIIINKIDKEQPSQQNSEVSSSDENNYSHNLNIKK